MLIQTQEKLNLLYMIYMKCISRKTLGTFVVTIYLLSNLPLKFCRYITYTIKVLVYFFSSRNTQSQYKNVIYSHHNIIKGIIIFYM